MKRKTKKRPFKYRVPAGAIKAKKRKPFIVPAWKTECPGLIIQTHLGSIYHFNLVHENSGFIARAMEEWKRYQEIGKKMRAFGKIDWTVKKGSEIFEQIGKLSDADASRFLKILTGRGDKQPAQFRKNCLLRAKGWDQYVAQQRKEVK